MIIKPMLAATIDPKVDPDVFKKLRFPYLASPKLDGIRGVASGKEGLISRSGLPLPSVQAQRLFGHLVGLDGELIVGEPNVMNVYNLTQSHVMSQNKPAMREPNIPNLHYYVFDRWMHNSTLVIDMPFYKRLELLPKGDSFLIPVQHQLIENYDDLMMFEEICLNHGYEGIMLRNPHGRYKHGRATFNENLLYKLKRFDEFEAVVIDVVEQMTNLNEKVKNMLGYSERSTNAENLVPANTLGKMVVMYDGEPLNIGCGCMNHDERKYYWDNPHLLKGKTIVVRHFQVGIQGYRPRQARFAGFREDGR